MLVLALGGNNLLQIACQALSSVNGLKLHALISEPPRALRFSRRLASLEQFDSRAGEDALLDRVATLCRRHSVHCILPVTTADVGFVSRNREQLAEFHPVVVPDPALLETVAAKQTFTALVDSLGLPTPHSIKFDLTSSPAEVNRDLTYPVLAKPTVSKGGGVGIQRLANAAALHCLYATLTPQEEYILQEIVPGEDVALSLLANEGEVFAVMMRKRWFTRHGAPAFGAIQDLEFFHSDWLEALGREFVTKTCFTGIADFDLRVDFATRRAWFLECDPRLMGTMAAGASFGLNVPWLLIQQALNILPPGVPVNKPGYFISSGSLLNWIASGGWKTPRQGPLKTNLWDRLQDPLPLLLERLTS